MIPLPSPPKTTYVVPPFLFQRGTQHITSAPPPHVQTLEARLVDVREEDEHEIARISAFTLLPMSRANTWLRIAVAEWEKDVPVVVMCHAGIRSN